MRIVLKISFATLCFKHSKTGNLQAVYGTKMGGMGTKVLINIPPFKKDRLAKVLCGWLCCCLLTRESTQGENCQFQTVTNAKLVENAGQMMLYRVAAETEPLGDRLVRFAVDNRRNNLKLA
jgi:hypothetical protein